MLIPPPSVLYRITRKSTIRHPYCVQLTKYRTDRFAKSLIIQTLEFPSRMSYSKECITLSGKVLSSRSMVTMRKASSRASAPLSLENTTHTKKLLSGELSLKDIPGPSPSLPFFGTTWQYAPLIGRYKLSEVHDSFVDKFERYGPVVREEFHWRQPVVHLFDPADHNAVLQAQGWQPTRQISEFVKHYRMCNPDKYDTPGLANSVGKEWIRLRNVLGPVLLQLNALDGLLPDMNAIADDFVDLLRNKRHPQTHLISSVQDFAYRLSLESVYMMSLDSRLGCLKPDLQPNTVAFDMIDSVKLLFEAFQGLYYAVPFWKFFKTPSYQKLEKAESTMYKATSDRIQEAIQKLRETGSIKNDEEKPSILETLLFNKALTDKEIRVTVIDFISGGVFTVANAFTYLLYHLSRNPDVQEKLYQEVKRVAPDGVITRERLSRLNYLEDCVKESFRLTPIIPCLTRILPHDIQASGYHIPAGTNVFCHFSVACKQPDRFPNPDSFVPERWRNESSKGNSVPLKPFGSGSRMCVGRNFAKMEMYTALAKLAYNFRMESTGQEIKSKHVFVVVPTDAVSLILRDR